MLSKVAAQLLEQTVEEVLGMYGDLRFREVDRECRIGPNPSFSKFSWVK